jgi:phosphatidylinositol alpha-1,6-mannosyltransferase
MASRPRLLILTPDFPPARGGIQVTADRLAAGIKCFDTRVITLDSPGAAQFDRERRLAVRRVPDHGRLRGGASARLNLAALRLALSFRPDVTISLHIVTSPAAVAIRRAVGAPIVQYFHAEEIGAKPKLAAFAVRHADEVVAVSPYTAGLITATGSIPASMTLISPGVDLPSDSTSLTADRPTFLTISRIAERYKGHDVLVRALPLVRAKVPRVEWIVIGDGPLRPGVEQLASSYAVADSIEFLGSVSDERRDEWLRRAEVLAMPSRLPGGGLPGEGFGIVYLEAGAYGMPVVAGNVGGGAHAVADGESGLLVDPTDSVAVAEAITRLLLDRELAERLGRGGQRRARDAAWPTVIERVEVTLLEQLGDRSRSGGSRRSAHEDSARTAA